MSAPLDGDAWDGPTGLIHDVLRRECLARYPEPTAVTYFVCGPPVMVQATREMLRHEFRVPADAIVTDEF